MESGRGDGMRLISKDDLIDLYHIMADKCDGLGESIWNQFATTVEWCVEVDAVPVVRCGECRNYDPYTSGLSLGRGWCDALDTEVYDGFFCADGERKGEG